MRPGWPHSIPTFPSRSHPPPTSRGRASAEAIKPPALPAGQSAPSESGAGPFSSRDCLPGCMMHRVYIAPDSRSIPHSVRRSAGLAGGRPAASRALVQHMGAIAVPFRGRIGQSDWRGTLSARCYCLRGPGVATCLLDRTRSPPSLPHLWPANLPHHRPAPVPPRTCLPEPSAIDGCSAAIHIAEQGLPNDFSPAPCCKTAVHSQRRHGLSRCRRASGWDPCIAGGAAPER